MTDKAMFKLSPKLVEMMLENSFSISNDLYTDTTIYVGLGIDFDEETFSFSKEPVSKGFTINKNPCFFSEPVNGIIRNSSAIEWEKAKVDWTKNGDTIKYIGLYYKRIENDIPKYELICVLPLIPEETVNVGEKMVLNPNSIQIKLSNR